MKICKVENLKKLTKDSETILLNVNLKSWIKVNNKALEILDCIDNLDTDCAVKKIEEEYKASKEQAKGFIDYMINTGVLEKNSETNYINLVTDNSDKCSRKINECYIHITSKCNLSCGYCYYDANSDRENELSAQEMKSVIRRLSANGLKQIVISGGEPLMSKDFEDLVKYAKKFFNDIGMVTNATLITPEKAEFISKYINKVQVSLDSGIEADHDAIRGKGNFKRTVDGIKLLNQYGNILIKIAPTINKLNIKNIESIVHIAKDLDVGLEARFFLPVGRGNCNQKQFAIEDEEIANALKRIWLECEKINYNKYSIKTFYNSHALPKTTCGACAETICVDVNGDLYPCGFLMDKALKIGNILEKSDIYNTIEKSSIAKKILARDVDKLEECKNCNVRYFCGGGCMGIIYNQTGSLCGKDQKCDYYKNLYSQMFWMNKDGNLKKILYDIT